VKIWVDAVIHLEGNEDSLIDALTWLLPRVPEFKVDEEEYIDVKIMDAEKWVESLHRHVFNEPEEIDGTLSFSIGLARNLGLTIEEEVEFSSSLEDVEGEEGVVVTLGRPIHRRYHIIGLNREEFKVTDTEEAT